MKMKVYFTLLAVRSMKNKYYNTDFIKPVSAMLQPLT